MKSTNTYLTFGGSCRQAMEFYQQCIGGKLNIMPFSQAPPEAQPKDEKLKNNIMHAHLENGPFLLMASDGMPGMPVQHGNNFHINLNCESEQEIEKLFKALGAGGQVIVPLNDTFWGAKFGIIKDKFGIGWMFNYDKQQHA